MLHTYNLLKRIQIFGKSLAFADGECISASAPIANNSGTVVVLSNSYTKYDITGILSSFLHPSLSASLSLLLFPSSSPKQPFY